MSDSQLVKNSNAPASAADKKAFVQSQSYAPQLLKKQDLFSSKKLKSKDMFGRLGITTSESK